MVLITIVTGAYKPTYNWGASHCISGWMTPLSTSRLLGAMLTHLACRCPTAVSVFRTLSKKVGCVYIYITIYIYVYHMYVYMIYEQLNIILYVSN